MLKTNILGLPAITALNLAGRLDSVDVDDIIKQNPDIFCGFENLGDEYEFKLDENAKPNSLHTPRNVPLSQHEKVKQELERMEALGVMAKEKETTP